MEALSMGKKLENNGLWESSRMIIPQHKEAALNQAADWKHIDKPELDDQQFELISAAIGHSYSNHLPVTITVYDGFQYHEVIGTVTKVDKQLKRVRIDSEEEYEWVNMGVMMKLSYNVDNLRMFYYFYQYIFRVIINFVEALHYEK
jgi:hypothetical protein